MTDARVVIDACCVINLLATRRACEVIAAMGWTLLMTKHTHLEADYLEDPPDLTGRRTRIPVDTTDLQIAGRLQIVDLTADWTDAFVSCAEHLNDADASAVALAGSLSLPLISDDVKVRRVAREFYEFVDVWSTLKLLRAATERLGLDRSQLERLVRDVRWRGRFLPPNGDRDREWFRDLLGQEAR